MRVTYDQVCSDGIHTLSFYVIPNDIEYLRLNLDRGALNITSHDFTKQELIKLKHIVDRALHDVMNSSSKYIKEFE